VETLALVGVNSAIVFSHRDLYWALYPADSPSYLRSTPRSIANDVCDFLGWLSLALAAFWVYRMKGLRWFAVSVVTVLEMILVGAFFVAGMAISGDWL